MNNKYQIQKSASRAIEIYKYALTQGDRPFTAESIPGWSWDVSNQTSMGMLTSRGLVRMVKVVKPRRYVLVRVTDPANCLNVNVASDAAAGVVRYTAPLGVLDRLGGEPELRKYQIKAWCNLIGGKS